MLQEKVADQDRKGHSSIRVRSDLEGAACIMIVEEAVFLTWVSLHGALLVAGNDSDVPDLCDRNRSRYLDESEDNY